LRECVLAVRGQLLRSAVGQALHPYVAVLHVGDRSEPPRLALTREDAQGDDEDRHRTDGGRTSGGLPGETERQVLERPYEGRQGGEAWPLRRLRAPGGSVRAAVD